MASVILWSVKAHEPRKHVSFSKHMVGEVSDWVKVGIKSRISLWYNFMFPKKNLELIDWVIIKTINQESMRTSIMFSLLLVLKFVYLVLSYSSIIDSKPISKKLIYLIIPSSFCQFGIDRMNFMQMIKWLYLNALPYQIDIFTKHVRGTTPSLDSRLAMTKSQPRPNC